MVIAGAIGYFVANREPAAPQEPVGSGAAPEAIAAISGYQYTEEYAHPSGEFSFMYPSDFVVTSIPSGEGEAILVQNTETKIGAQILVTPFEGEDIDITEAVIRDSISDMDIREPQPVEIGEDRLGLAFLSDNESFGGSSREVWFVFRGNLYQISTYADLDPFLQGLFATWKFL